MKTLQIGVNLNVAGSNDELIISLGVGRLGNGFWFFGFRISGLHVGKESAGW